MKRKFWIFIILLVIISFLIISIRFFILKKNQTTANLIWGIPVWQIKFSDEIFSTLVDNDFHLIVETADSFASVSCQEKRIIWDLKSENSIVNELKMVTQDQYLVSQWRNAQIKVINADTGDLLWQFSDPNGYFIEDMQISDKSLFVVSYEQYLRIYDLKTGKIIWEIDAPSRERLFVFSDGNFLYFGANSFLSKYENQVSGVYSFHWKIDFREHAGFMEKMGDTLFLEFYTKSGISIQAMDLLTEQIVWEIKSTDLPQDARVLRIIDQGDRLYALGNYIIALSTDGKLSWVSEKGAYKDILLINDRLWVLNKNFLSILDANNGHVIYKVLLPGNIDVSAVFGNKQVNMFSNGKFINIVSNNTIFCFDYRLLSEKFSTLN